MPYFKEAFQARIEVYKTQNGSQLLVNLDERYINPVLTTKHYKRFPPFSILIEEIRRKVASDEFEFSKHAVDQSILRQIRIHEIKEVIANSQVIEDYPNDK